MGVLYINRDLPYIIYERLIEHSKLSDGLKERFRTNRTIIDSIYDKIEGEWWKRGWFTQLYRLENFFGKARYELKQDSKVMDIISNDLQVAIAELNNQEDSS